LVLFNVLYGAVQQMACGFGETPRRRQPIGLFQQSARAFRSGLIVIARSVRASGFLL